MLVFLLLKNFELPSAEKRWELYEMGEKKQKVVEGEVKNTVLNTFWIYFEYEIDYQKKYRIEVYVTRKNI